MTKIILTIDDKTRTWMTQEFIQVQIVVRAFFFYRIEQAYKTHCFLFIQYFQAIYKKIIFLKEQKKKSVRNCI